MAVCKEQEICRPHVEHHPLNNSRRKIKMTFWYRVRHCLWKLIAKFEIATSMLNINVTIHIHLGTYKSYICIYFIVIMFNVIHYLYRHTYLNKSSVIINSINNIYRLRNVIENNRTSILHGTVRGRRDIPG